MKTKETEIEPSTIDAAPKQLYLEGDFSSAFPKSNGTYTY
jgi:hypothetical protein